MITKKFITNENNEIMEEFYDTVTQERGNNELLKKRYRIQAIKGDMYALISQSIQWNSLLTSLMKDVYEALDDTTKEKIPVDKRQLIEMTFDYFDSIETVADIKIKKEGFNFIKNVFDKEAETAKLFK